MNTTLALILLKMVYLIKYKKWVPDGSKSAIYNGVSIGLYVWKNGVMEFSRSLTKEELEQAKNNTNQ